jgi:hypothetical protein
VLISSCFVLECWQERKLRVDCTKVATVDFEKVGISRTFSFFKIKSTNICPDQPCIAHASAAF